MNKKFLLLLFIFISIPVIGIIAALGLNFSGVIQSSDLKYHNKSSLIDPYSGNRYYSIAHFVGEYAHPPIPQRTFRYQEDRVRNFMEPSTGFGSADFTNGDAIRRTFDNGVVCLRRSFRGAGRKREWFVLEPRPASLRQRYMTTSERDCRHQQFCIGEAARLD